MIAESVSATSALDWGVASRPMPGEVVCGDVHLIKPIRDGVLAAVVDGLGHGQEALEAATAAIAVLESYEGEPLTTLVKQCHEALMRTRGAVMAVATLDMLRGQLNWVGVGSILVV